MFFALHKKRGRAGGHPGTPPRIDSLQLDIIFIVRQTRNCSSFLRNEKAGFSGAFCLFRVKSEIKPFFDTLPL